MRSTTFFFLLLIFLSSCSSNKKDDGPSIKDPTKRNENWCWFEDADTGEAKWIKVKGGRNVVQNGKYTLFYSNGAIREKGIMRNGKNVDTTRIYSPKKFELVKYYFRDSITDSIKVRYPKDGQFKILYANLNPCEEGFAKNQLRTGLCKSYYKNGARRSISRYDNGEMNGENKFWNKSGILIDHSYWKNGKQDGLALLYYENGKFKEKCHWKNAKLDGLAQSYYENGNLKDKSYWKNGKQEGPTLFYFENGNLEEKCYWKNGKLNGPFELYHKNGEIKEKGIAENNMVIGKVSLFDEDGKLYQVDTYVDGEIVETVEY
ncbi:MAG: toxin-antitoxin system YwqK family antitoxin [bacterium]|nr:toxin-antitoxin system YwqK family antitoxin [bacterium]